MSGFEKMEPEQYRELKQKEREEVYEMLSETTQDLMDRGEMIAYLDLQAKLFDQTPSNVLLIKKQLPEATWIRSAEEWKSDNIYTIKGKEAIKILSSSSYRKDDGSLGTSYNVAKVFDISQTTASNRTIHSKKYRNVHEAILHRFPCTLEVTGDVPGGLDAVYDRDQEVIFVREGMDKDKSFLAIARELSCYELMRMDYNKSRDDVLPYAECAAYLLAKRYGVDAPEPDVDRLIEGFNGREKKQVRKDLSDMKRSASVIDVKIKEFERKAREDKESER